MSAESGGACARPRSDVVLFEKADGIAIIRLNRPRVHNAISPETIRALASIWQEIALDREVRAAILTGEGQSFCSGMDLKATDPGFGPRGDDGQPTAVDHFAALRGERRRIGYVQPTALYKPLIAAISGVAAGGGCELALGCDIRIAAVGSRIGLPEVSRGLVPGSGGLYWLPRIVGLSRAMELLLTGELIDAEEALRIGLVSRVVPKDDLMPTAIRMAHKIAGNAPLAVQGAKEAVWRSLGAGIDEGMALSEQQTRLLRLTEDYQEGIAAFREKRQPRFQGK